MPEDGNDDDANAGRPEARVEDMSAKPQSLLWGRCYLGCHAPLTADGWGVSRARLLKLGTCAAAQRWLAWRRGEGFEEKE